MKLKSLLLPQIFLNLDLKIYRKYPSRILFSIFQIFLMIFLFFYISETIGQVAILKMEYFPFVATGLSFQYFFSGIVNASSEKLEEYRDYGVIEEILFGRFPCWWVMLSAGFHEILVASLKSLLIFSTVAFAFQLQVDFLLLSLCLLTSFSLALSLSFVASCSFLMWKRFSLLEIGGTLITLFLSGIYFPVSVLPSLIQNVAQLNPLLHALSLFRLALGMESEQQWGHSLAVVVMATLLVSGFNLILYNYCLKRLKGSGISEHF